MIKSPFIFEEWLRPAEFEKIGKMLLQWSHIEHIIGNCLKVMLRLDDEEAILLVFTLSLERRLSKMKELARLKPLSAEAERARSELTAVMKGIQFVRNHVAHTVMSDNVTDGTRFHLRSKKNFLTKEEVLSVEELTNYAGTRPCPSGMLWD